MLNSSDHQAVLFLGNLVEGKYSFILTVTDSKGQSSKGRGTVEVKPGKQTYKNMHMNTNPQDILIIFNNMFLYFI